MKPLSACSSYSKTSCTTWQYNIPFWKHAQLENVWWKTLAEVGSLNTHLQLYTISNRLRTSIPDDEPFFPAGTVIADLERVYSVRGRKGVGSASLRGGTGRLPEQLLGTVSEEAALDKTKVERAVSRGCR